MKKKSFDGRKESVKQGRVMVQVEKNSEVKQEAKLESP